MGLSNECIQFYFDTFVFRLLNFIFVFLPQLWHFQQKFRKIQHEASFLVDSTARVKVLFACLDVDDDCYRVGRGNVILPDYHQFWACVLSVDRPLV